MNKIRLGIIGVGSHGTGHLRNIRKGMTPEIEVTAVCDIDADAKTRIYNEFGGIPFFTDSHELIVSGLVDAVLIVTPHYFHPPISMDAMEHGLHVMCEKPAGVYTKQVKEMNTTAEKTNVVFGMMFNQRTNPVYIKTRELVQSGEFGQIRRVSWIITNWYRPQAYYDSGAWRATWSGEGGGVLLNQCPHNLDLWQWICGMPVKIQTNMHFGKWHDIEVEDDVTTYVEYENGATGVFVTTTGDGRGTNRFEIQMDGAKLIVENDKLYLDEFSVSEPEFSATNKVPFISIPSTFSEVETDGLNPQHGGVMNAWAGAILRGEPLVADGREGIRGLTLSNAMHLSSFTGRAVTLPIDEDLFYEELKKRIATSRRKEVTESVVSDLSNTYGGAK